MNVTRTIYADVPPGLAAICKAAGFLRADIWRRYGALGNVGKSASFMRTEIVKQKTYDTLHIDGTIRAETTKDVVNDILTYKAAAKLKVRQSIAKRTSDESERKRLYILLKRDAWLSDTYLHRQMRKHFRHVNQLRINPMRRYAQLFRNSDQPDKKPAIHWLFVRLVIGMNYCTVMNLP
ncbi:MAG: hypothetical protein LRY49_07935 [Burkholderiaceae bacterium]|nr:hypothetical protein [Burkholderiaceae bacterium]